jgi:hypothetical protein
MEILNLMNKRLAIMALTLSIAQALYGQQDTWDIPVTEQMISQNKQNYSDHQEVKNNQIVSQATVSRWKSSTNQFKTLSDYIDIRNDKLRTKVTHYCKTASMGAAVDGQPAKRNYQ